jgi:WD40 repeat protein
MVAAILLFVEFGAGLAASHLLIDLDKLPPGAKARLGSTRYDTGRSLAPSTLCLSPDGKRVAVQPDGSRGVDRCINIHDAETGKQLRTLRMPEGAWAGTIRFATPSKVIATYEYNAYQLHVFDAETGRCETVLAGLEASGTWSYLAHVSDDAQTVIEFNGVKAGDQNHIEYVVWQTKPLKKLQVIRPVHRINDNPWRAWSKLSRNGSTLLTGGHNATKGSTDYEFVQVWDTKTGKERKRIEVEDGRDLWRLAINPDGSRLAVATKGAVKAFDTHSGKLAFTIATETEPDNEVEFDHFGTRLLLYRSRTVTVFSAKDGKRLQEYKLPWSRDPEHQRSHPVEFTATGQARLVDSPNVWNLETGKRQGECGGHGYSIQTLRFSPDGKQLTSIDNIWPGGGELIWDLSKRSALETTPRYLKIRGTLNFEWWGAWRTPDGNALLAWDTGRDANRESFVAYDARTGGRLYHIDFPDWFRNWERRSVTFSPDGKTFLHTGSSVPITGDFPVYETAGGKIAYRVKFKEVDGVLASFSADNSHLALLTSSTKAKITQHQLILVDTKTGKEVRRQTVPEGIKQFWLLSDTRTALALGEDENHLMVLRTWDTQTGKVLRSWMGKQFLWELGAEGVVLSDDRKLMGCGMCPVNGHGLDVRVIETETFVEQAAFIWPLGRRPTVGTYPGSPTTLRFSPDNRTLAVGVNDGTIVLYDIPPQAKKPNPK